VNIASTDTDSAQRAIRMIEDLVMEAEVGKTYLGTVTRLVDFGAFVEIFPGTEGLLHISEVADFRVQDINSELKVGDQIPVKVISIEPPNKIRLSRKAVLREQAGLPPLDPAPERPGAIIWIAAGPVIATGIATVTVRARAEESGRTPRRSY